MSAVRGLHGRPGILKKIQAAVHKKHHTIFFLLFSKGVAKQVQSKDTYGDRRVAISLQCGHGIPLAPS